jgi:hypothetical protein
MDHLVTLTYDFHRLMNFQRTILGFIIALTIALILFPILLPPAPIWPSLLELIPLLLLICAAFMFRRNFGILYLLFVITLIGQCVRFDALRSNVLLPWRFSGLISDYVAWIEIAAVVYISTVALLSKSRASHKNEPLPIQAEKRVGFPTENGNKTTC